MGKTDREKQRGRTREPESLRKSKIQVKGYFNAEDMDYRVDDGKSGGEDRA